MRRVSVKCEISTYPDEATPAPHPRIALRGHWQYKDRVIISVGDEEHIVLTSDLMDAVRKVEL